MKMNKKATNAIIPWHVSYALAGMLRLMSWVVDITLLPQHMTYFQMYQEMRCKKKDEVKMQEAQVVVLLLLIEAIHGLED